MINLPEKQLPCALPLRAGEGQGRVVQGKVAFRFVLGVFIFLQFSCATDLEKVKKISIQSNTISERGEQVEMHYSVQGVLKAKITAPEVTNHESDDTYSEFPKGVKLYSYDEAMKTTSQLSANYGIYYPKKEEMLVRDNVVIVNTKGELLNTEELIWKRKEEKIYSDKFVRITTPEEIIYGTGFEAKQDFSDYIIKNISGIVQVQEGKVPGTPGKGM